MFPPPGRPDSRTDCRRRKAALLSLFRFVLAKERPPVGLSEYFDHDRNGAAQNDDRGDNDSSHIAHGLDHRLLNRLAAIFIETAHQENAAAHAVVLLQRFADLLHNGQLFGLVHGLVILQDDLGGQCFAGTEALLDNVIPFHIEITFADFTQGFIRNIVVVRHDERNGDDRNDDQTRDRSGKGKPSGGMPQWFGLCCKLPLAGQNTFFPSSDMKMGKTVNNAISKTAMPTATATAD